MSVVFCARARRLRSAAGSINSGRHILESRCAERCANDAFSTSFQATLIVFGGELGVCVCVGGGGVHESLAACLFTII